MESRDPRSIRFCASEWHAVTDAARARGMEPAAFARDLCLMALMIVQSPVLMEGHLRNLSVIRAGSQAEKTNGVAVL
jgi:hypothetical protein